MYAVLLPFLCLQSADVAVLQNPVNSFWSKMSTRTTVLGKSPVTTRVTLNERVTLPPRDDDPTYVIVPPPSQQAAKVSAPPLQPDVVPPALPVLPQPPVAHQQTAAQQPMVAENQQSFVEMIRGSIAPPRAAPAQTNNAAPANGNGLRSIYQTFLEGR